MYVAKEIEKAVRVNLHRQADPVPVHAYWGNPELSIKNIDVFHALPSK